MDAESHGIRDALLEEYGRRGQEPDTFGLAEVLGAHGIPCRFFRRKQLQRRQLPLHPQTLVASTIPVVLASLKQLGIEPPPALDYPECLQPWLRRRIWTSTLGEVRARLEEDRTAAFFVKPAGGGKRFTGVAVGSWLDLGHFSGISRHLPVYCSEVVDWLAEVRVYVIRGRIEGMGWYRGQLAEDLDHAAVQEAVRVFEASGQAPAAYGMDFGILRSGETALVEVNDGFSLCSYGRPPAIYTELVLTRWEE